MSDFEKLGTFYLGRPYDLANKSAKPGLLWHGVKSCNNTFFRLHQTLPKRDHPLFYCQT